MLLEVKESGRGDIEAADFLLEWRHWQRGVSLRNILSRIVVNERHWKKREGLTLKFAKSVGSSIAEMRGLYLVLWDARF